jgi:hypothetical protein
VSEERVKLGSCILSGIDISLQSWQSASIPLFSRILRLHSLRRLLGPYEPSNGLLGLCSPFSSEPSAVQPC